MATVDIRGVEKYFGAAHIIRGVDISIEDGQFAVLVGPSGCGKSTLLRMLAGLEEISKGEIRIGDRVVSGPGVHVPPERRRIGMVFQDWALFPHLDVARNVAYGLPRGPGRDERVAEALAMVGLAGLGDRMPGTLSGGQ
ncbi:MAG TPA: ABC transporter ATP-binding protein, partial [Ramlibacter sp.]